MNELVIALVLTFLQPPPVALDGIEPRATIELGLFDGRTACEIAAVTWKTHAKGARIACVPRLLSPDEKRAIAIAEGRGR